MLLRHIFSPAAGAPTPAAGGRLAGEKFRSPAFACHARPLGCNRVGGFTGQAPHDLPTDSRVRVEEPLEVRGPGYVIVSAHWFLIARAPNRVHIGSGVWQKLGQEAFRAGRRPSGGYSENGPRS